MRVVVELSPEILAFVESAVDLPIAGGTTGVVSYANNGQLAAAVVFTSPLYGNTFLSIAAAKNFWATKEFFHAIFYHGFETLGSTGLSAMVRADNIRSLRLVRTLGFRLEGVMKGFDFGDMLMFGMLRGECRWLGPYQSQKL